MSPECNTKEIIKNIYSVDKDFFKDIDPKNLVIKIYENIPEISGGCIVEIVKEALGIGNARKSIVYGLRKIGFEAYFKAYVLPNHHMPAIYVTKLPNTKNPTLDDWEVIGWGDY